MASSSEPTGVPTVRHLSQLTNAGMVKIIIQEKARDNDVALTETTFLVHCALLTLHSQYFKNALKGEWKEAQSRTITLTDVSCITFEIFVNWIYTHKLPVELRDSSQVPFSGSATTKDIESDLSKVRCVIFCDSYAAAKFRSECEHVIIGDLVHKGFPYFEPIILAFANLPSTNNVLRVMVDSHVYGYNEANEIDLRAELPRSFLVQIMIRYSQVANKKVKPTLHECDYHDHVSEEEKGSCHGRESEQEEGCPAWKA